MLVNETLSRDSEDFATIYLNTRQGQVSVLISKQDMVNAAELSRLVLYKDPKGRQMARADKNDDQVLLHRHLFDIPKGSKLEWLNEDTLDLRRENLQLVHKDKTVEPLKPLEEIIFVEEEHPEDLLEDFFEEDFVEDEEHAPIMEFFAADAGHGKINPGKLSKQVNTQPIKGVTKHKASGKWTSRPYYDSKRYSLGYFETQEEALQETRLFFAEGPESPNLKRNQRKGNN